MSEKKFSIGKIVRIALAVTLIAGSAYATVKSDLGVNKGSWFSPIKALLFGLDDDGNLDFGNIPGMVFKAIGITNLVANIIL